MAQRSSQHWRYRKLIGGAAACLALLLASVTGPMPRSHAEVPPSDHGSTQATVSSVAPDLTLLADTNAVHIEYEWQGLDATIAIDYPLVLKGRAFAGEAVRSEVPRLPLGNEPPRTETKHRTAIPHKMVRKFLLSVLAAHAEEGEYRARLDHTDDYPRLVFEVHGPKGDVLIGTLSQPTVVKGVHVFGDGQAKINLIGPDGQPQLV